MHLRTLLIAAALAIAPAAAQAGTVTFDDLGGANQSPFTTYSEAGFTVTKTSGDIFVGQAFGNPVPDLFMGPAFGSATSTLQVTAGGSPFTFASWDLSANNGPTDWLIQGFLNSALTFTASGTDSLFGFQTLASGASQSFDQLTFTLHSNGTSSNFDNFVGTIGPGVPEPATWALMIAGLGLAGAGLRRHRAADAGPVAA